MVQISSADKSLTVETNKQTNKQTKNTQTGNDIFTPDRQINAGKNILPRFRGENNSSTFIWRVFCYNTFRVHIKYDNDTITR